MINQLFQNTITGTGTDEERALVESNIIEVIQLAGQNWLYLPRQIYDLDPILHEDPNSGFAKGYTIEMYLQNSIGYGSGGYLLSKFGVEVNETIELVVSRKRFLQETKTVAPKEGDLLYHPVYKALFEINFIDFDLAPSFYQLAKNFTWLMKASFFSYSYETIKTGNSKVDAEFKPGTFVDPFANNKEINDAAKQILDYTEENIFGDITEPDDSGLA